MTSSPSGIDCGDTCTQNRQGARPDHSTIDPRPRRQGHRVKRLTNTGPVLSVSVAGGRGGKVTSSPSGIDCGDTRSAAFTQGTQVTLSARPRRPPGASRAGGRMQRGRPELCRDNQCQYQRVRDLPPFLLPLRFSSPMPRRCRPRCCRRFPWRRPHFKVQRSAPPHRAGRAAGLARSRESMAIRSTAARQRGHAR